MTFYDVRTPGFTILGDNLTMIIEYTKESPFSVRSRTVGYFVLREDAEAWVVAHTDPSMP